MRLADIHPTLDAGALAARFVPPHRFSDVRFSSYEPDPAHASQTAARELCRSFISTASPPKRSLFRRAPTENAPSGLYLDGGFGVGKTHLLASTFHEFDGGQRAYLTFTELTAFIGFVGMRAAQEAFRSYRLVCIDEFELDDIANTLMVVTFLRDYLRDGRKVAVTSNTVPDRLGEGRFSADEFRREIRSIASHFRDFRIDGEDFRSSHAALPLTLHHQGDRHHVSDDDFATLLGHLRAVHPVQYGAMFDNVEAVRITDLRPLDAQDDALRFVQFIDKLYDAQVPVRITGCAVDEVFDASYRSGGYRKKYGRAESRMVAMASESHGVFGG